MNLLSSLLKRVTTPRDSRSELRRLYLDLMQRILINTIYEDPQTITREYKPKTRELGLDWPSVAHSMIGRHRMNNLRTLCEDVITRRIPGDYIETGVWRGGACILMRAVLKAHGVTDRCIWVADSFQGLPPPSADKYPADATDTLYRNPQLAISLEEVKANFDKYDFLDNQVRFLQGWFKDTLPCAPIEQLAILRLDGDMYESTMDGLKALYHKLSPGGYVIVDDYHLDNCRAAITDFRATHNIADTIIEIDGSGVYWKKSP